MAGQRTGDEGSGAKRVLFSLVPGLRALTRYKLGHLRGDIFAGLAVAALMVPQAMAYAELAGLPAVTGLYTTIMAMLAYAVFGPSRILVVGPDSALATLILAAILPLVGAGGDPARAMALASALAIMLGVICLVVWRFNLGIITELLSKPLRTGYLNGVAIVIIVSQLPTLFGFTVQGEGTLGRLEGLIGGVLDGQTNLVSLAIGTACLALLFGWRKVAPILPAPLVVVVLATLAVYLFGLAGRGIDVVGPVPAGLPSFHVPAFALQDVARLLPAAAAMSFVMLAGTSALSRAFALKYGRKMQRDQEILALGIANVASGLFQGFPASASSSRTTMADHSGGKTQMVGLVGIVVIMLLLLLANGSTTYLPQASLAAIVILAGTLLFDMKSMRWLWRVRRSEFILSFTALMGVAVLGVFEGIGIAIVLSLGAFLQRMWRPYDAVLGRVTERHGYHDLARHPGARQIPGLLIYRFDAPVFFANAEHFAWCIKRRVREREDVRRVVVAGEPITDIDTTGAEALVTLISDLRTMGVTFAFAELKGPVKDRLKGYGVYHRVGDENYYSTLAHAIADYVESTGGDVLDWIDECDVDQPDADASEGSSAGSADKV